eukprot:6378652-Amphidinium_carterae.1
MASPSANRCATRTEREHTSAHSCKSIATSQCNHAIITEWQRARGHRISTTPNHGTPSEDKCTLCFGNHGVLPPALLLIRRRGPDLKRTLV